MCSTALLFSHGSYTILGCWLSGRADRNPAQQVPTQATNFIGLAAASAMGLVYQASWSVAANRSWDRHGENEANSGVKIVL